MKFATCLVLAAVAVASATAATNDDCSFACLDVYDPVSDENGKTYSNECYMRLAKCQEGKAMKFATCLVLAAVAVASATAATNDDCSFACLDVYDPVSDENGKTYSNECYMRLAKCKDSKTDNNNGAMDPAYTLRNID
ncbi:hypothetical protein BBJ29_005879 [Phytophthora kernoviae]|uniref:Kazal-like domain-containing protein n=1 Tax=Phytophthora kernoviae TaxID=325452 RepID=A0A3F2RGM6_9STRA|nr:hypothetical protein BBJ29_005879 [Phytophthora kernoviae]RLN56458.1 hypothetical protein BBP00_00007998 [Phytophthora kernoviae]